MYDTLLLIQGFIILSGVGLLVHSATPTKYRFVRAVLGATSVGFVGLAVITMFV